MDELPRIHQVMPMLACLHDALEGVDLPDAANDLRFGNYVAASDMVDSTTAGVRRLRRLDPSLRSIADIATAVADQLLAAAGGAAAFPSQW
ncbi:MAG: hypothetical protein ACRDZW_06690 [Acidimicrobiales bacterium]